MRNRESWYKSLYWRFRSLPAPSQPLHWQWVCALWLALKSWFLPISHGKKLFLVKYWQNQCKFCKKCLVWSFPLGKETKKTHQTTPPQQNPKHKTPKSIQKMFGWGKSAGCQGQRLLLTPAVCLPRRRWLQKTPTISRSFQFWGNLHSKQVPFPCRCALKTTITLPASPIKESVRSSQWNWFFISQASEAIIIIALLCW